MDLPGPLAHLVEEPPVVGHDHQRLVAGAQVVGQPRDGLDVEVVGGLVEDHQVVVAEQQRGQRAAAPLPAREADDRPVQGDTGEQLLDDLAGAALRRPLVVGHPAEHRLADAVGVDELVALVEVADQQPAATRDPPGVGLLEAGHDLQQRRLAVAVAPDDPDPVALTDTEGDLREQRAHAVGLRDQLEVQQVRHGVSPPARRRRRPRARPTRARGRRRCAGARRRAWPR